MNEQSELWGRTVFESEADEAAYLEAEGAVVFDVMGILYCAWLDDIDTWDEIKGQMECLKAIRNRIFDRQNELEEGGEQ